MRLARLKAGAIALVVALATSPLVPLSALAGGPPVRIAVVPGGGSGIEQDIVDRISNELSNNPKVAVSTVNPDWYVVCNIKENMDQMSGQIRYNGNVLIKTKGGQVLGTVAVQKYNQDFSLSPGAPLNKALVDRAARDVIAAASERAMAPIERAVDTEMDTRDKIIKAQMLADSEEYDGAINALRLVTPESPHFDDVRDMMEEFDMERTALENIKAATAKAGTGQYSAAIAQVKQVSAKSRYKKRADQLAATWKAKAGGASKKLVKNKKPAAKPKTATAGNKQAELKALDKVLNLEKKAIEDAQAKVRANMGK